MTPQSPEFHAGRYGFPQRPARVGVTLSILGVLVMGAAAIGVALVTALKK